MSAGHFEFDPVVWTIVVQFVLPLFAPLMIVYVIIVVTFGLFMPRLKKNLTKKLPLPRIDISDKSVWEYFEALPSKSERMMDYYWRRYKRG